MSEINEKQKAMLADDLSAYISERHTQEECIGFIAGYNAAIKKLDSITIKCFTVGQEVAWKSGFYYVVEDFGGDKVLLSNTTDNLSPNYNDWLVDRIKISETA